MNRNPLNLILVGVTIVLASGLFGFIATSLLFSNDPEDIQSDDRLSLSDQLPSATDSSSSVPDKSDVSSAKDLVYCKNGGSEQLLDFYLPEGNGPFPVVIFIHGGGWSKGDKSENSEVYIPKLLENGIAVAPINYRLAREGKFPAMIEDAACAVRFLRSEANYFNIDPDNIGVFGGSAGGHLASLLGTMDDGDFLGDGFYSEYSNRVKAVGDLYGPIDLTIEQPGVTSQILKNVFGETTFSDMGFASPINYVSADDPAFIIFHGVDDEIIPISQSEAFYQALSSVGVSVEFIKVQSAGHAFVPSTKGVKTSPSVPQIAQELADWFKEHLK